MSDSYTRVGRDRLIARLEAYDAAVVRIRTRMDGCKRTQEANPSVETLARIQTYELVLAELEGRPL